MPHTQCVATDPAACSLPQCTQQQHSLPMYNNVTCTIHHSGMPQLSFGHHAAHPTLSQVGSSKCHRTSIRVAGKPVCMLTSWPTSNRPLRITGSAPTHWTSGSG
eukprot:2391752-Amphidinium_carterae.1